MKKSIYIVYVISAVFMLSCAKEGCIDPIAQNYNDEATKSCDGCCQFSPLLNLEEVFFEDFNSFNSGALWMQNGWETNYSESPLIGWTVGSQNLGPTDYWIKYDHNSLNHAYGFVRSPPIHIESVNDCYLNFDLFCDSNTTLALYVTDDIANPFLISNNIYLNYFDSTNLIMDSNTNSGDLFVDIPNTGTYYFVFFVENTNIGGFNDNKFYLNNFSVKN